VGLEPSTCSKVAKFLTIGATCSICLNVYLNIFIYLLAQHLSRRCPFTRVGPAFGKIMGKKNALSGNRTHIHRRPDVESAQSGEGPTWPNAHGRWPREAAQSRRNSAQPENNKKSSASVEVQNQDRLQVLPLSYVRFCDDSGGRRYILCKLLVKSICVLSYA